MFRKYQLMIWILVAVFIMICIANNKEIPKLSFVILKSIGGRV